MASDGKLLVLCVDRDNDVGEVLRIPTPIVGEKSVLDVAIKYALARPDDSDANAMFAALQTYRDLVKLQGEDRVEIAVITGLPEEDIRADMKILQELDNVLSRNKISGIVLISDGPTDEQVVPLLQSRVPVVSVKRIIVQQSRGIEETFVLIIRYARRLVEDEKYRKYTLGIPGLFFMLYISLSYFIPNYVWPLLTFVFGLLLFLKGFSIDEKILTIYKSSPVTFASLSLSLVFIIISILSGFSNILSFQGGLRLREVIGYFFLTPIGSQLFVIDLLVIAVALPILGRILDNTIFGKELKTLDMISLFALVIAREVVVEMCRVLLGYGSISSLFTWTFLALGIVVILTIIVSLGKRKV